MQRNRRREPISFMHWGAGPQCNLDEKHFFLCERPGWNLCKRRPLSRKSRKPSSRRNIYAMASPSSELRETRAAWAASQVKNTSTKGRDWLWRAHSGTSGHPFRSHPATCSDVFGHLWRVAVRQRVSGIRSEAFRHPFWRWFCAWTRLRVRGGRHCGRCGRGSHRRTSARR